jgi:F-type H+-transporting ATPase subunit b
MDDLVVVALASSDGQIQQIARTFGVDWPHLVAQIVSFCIVCVVLHRFAYRPVLRILEERRQRIAEGLANAEKIKGELARTEAQREEVIARANAQATKLIEEARLAAARVQEQETQKAISVAEQIIVKAREAAAQEQARMLAEARSEMGRLVVETTAAVTGKILTAEDQRRLTEETTKRLAAAA